MKMTFTKLICALLFVAGGTCFAYDEVGAYPNNAFAGLEYPSCCRGPYVRGFGGLNVARKPKWKRAQYNTSYGHAIGAAVGYHFDLISVEGEFSYRYNNIDRLRVDALDVKVSGHIEQLCGFGNVLFNIPLTHYFVTYAGAGAGYRHFKPGVNFDESADTSLRNLVNTSNEWGVYQIIGGLNFAVCRLLNLQLEYRYMDGWSNTKCANHTVDLSAMCHF